MLESPESIPINPGITPIVQGGFNLDVDGQKFRVGDVIPAGTLAIFNEATRKVQDVYKRQGDGDSSANKVAMKRMLYLPTIASAVNDI